MNPKDFLQIFGSPIYNTMSSEMRHKWANAFLICMRLTFSSLIGVAQTSSNALYKNGGGRLSGLLSDLKEQVLHVSTLNVIEAVLFFLNK